MVTQLLIKYDSPSASVRQCLRDAGRWTRTVCDLCPGWEGEVSSTVSQVALLCDARYETVILTQLRHASPCGLQLQLQYLLHQTQCTRDGAPGSASLLRLRPTRGLHLPTQLLT